MTAYLSPVFDTRSFDGSTVAAGYKLYTYDSGTTTPELFTPIRLVLLHTRTRSRLMPMAALLVKCSLNWRVYIRSENSGRLNYQDVERRWLRVAGVTNIACCYRRICAHRIRNQNGRRPARRTYINVKIMVRLGMG